MTNEEFQNLVLGELRGINGESGSIKEEIGNINGEISNLGSKIVNLSGDINNLKEGQARLEIRLERLENKLDAVYDQTQMLTEFRTGTIMKLDKLMEDNRSFHEIIGRHEVDITTLKRKYA